MDKTQFELTQDEVNEIFDNSDSKHDDFIGIQSAILAKVAPVIEKMETVIKVLESDKFHAEANLENISCLLEARDKQIAELKKSKWIDCNNSFPKETGTCLVYNTNGNYPVIQEARYSKFNWTWYDGSDAIHPTHWMPLPDAPVKEDRGNA